MELRIPGDQLIFGLVFGRGQTVTCDCGSICYQYFFRLNNDSPDAFLGPPPAAERSHQSDNTNIRSYFIKYIPIKLSKKVSKPKQPNRISDSTIHKKKLLSDGFRLHQVPIEMAQIFRLWSAQLGLQRRCPSLYSSELTVQGVKK